MSAVFHELNLVCTKPHVPFGKCPQVSALDRALSLKVNLMILYRTSSMGRLAQKGQKCNTQASPSNFRSPVPFLEPLLETETSLWAFCMPDAQALIHRGIPEMGTVVPIWRVREPRP
jgi:hypothetical protein